MRHLSITQACFGLLSLAAAIASGLVPATGQEPYPSRHVRIITTAGTGTSPDVVVRIIAEQLSRDWGQQVVVENNGTGGGLVAAQQAAAAAPDGYTLLLASASAFTVLPIRHEHAPTVVGRDLKPIAFLGELPMAYAVSAKLGVKSIKELIELSKREPEKIFYAANATGTLPHMAGEHFKSRAGASLTFVPYRGTADALAGVLSGHINAIVENYVTLAGQFNRATLSCWGSRPKTACRISRRCRRSARRCPGSLPSAGQPSPRLPVCPMQLCRRSTPTCAGSSTSPMSGSD